MNKTGKRVDVVKAVSDHPEEKKFDNDVPILFTVQRGTQAAQLMGKQVTATRPRHDCPDWATDDTAAEETSVTRTAAVTDGGQEGAIFRYDERGDQICTNCGYIRNQDTSETVHDHQHAGRYDGFDTGSNSISD
jgi:hypothetical protein